MDFACKQTQVSFIVYMLERQTNQALQENYQSLCKETRLSKSQKNLKSQRETERAREEERLLESSIRKSASPCFAPHLQVMTSSVNPIGAEWQLREIKMTSRLSSLSSSSTSFCSFLFQNSCLIHCEQCDSTSQKQILTKALQL